MLEQTAKDASRAQRVGDFEHFLYECKVVGNASADYQTRPFQILYSVKEERKAAISTKVPIFGTRPGIKMDGKSTDLTALQATASFPIETFATINEESMKFSVIYCHMYIDLFFNQPLNPLPLESSHYLPETTSEYSTASDDVPLLHSPI